MDYIFTVTSASISCSNQTYTTQILQLPINTQTAFQHRIPPDYSDLQSKESERSRNLALLRVIHQMYSALGDYLNSCAASYTICMRSDAKRKRHIGVDSQFGNAAARKIALQQARRSEQTLDLPPPRAYVRHRATSLVTASGGVLHRAIRLLRKCGREKKEHAQWPHRAA